MKFKKLFFLNIAFLFFFTFLTFQFSSYNTSKKISSAIINGYIKENLKKEKFKVAVVVKKLSKDSFWDNLFERGFFVSINKDEPFPAASLIKLPLMASSFLASEEGKINLQDIYILKDSDKTPGSGILKKEKAGKKLKILELIKLMVSRSDNTASNIIIKRLGFGYINESFKKLGLKNTRLERLVMDLSSRKKGLENIVTASDLAYILEKIYKKELINKDASSKMLKFLLEQKVKDRLPKYLPKDTRVANKTGTLRGIVHDVGIVFTPLEIKRQCTTKRSPKGNLSLGGFTKKGDYIICVLTEGIKEYKRAKDFIAKLSEFVYYLVIYGS